MDYQVKRINILSVRYQYYRQTQDNESVGAFNLASLGTNQYDSENTVQLSDTQTLSPRTINETTLSVSARGGESGPGEQGANGFGYQRFFANGGMRPEANDDTKIGTSCKTRRI